MGFLLWKLEKLGIQNDGSYMEKRQVFQMDINKIISLKNFNRIY